MILVLRAMIHVVFVVVVELVIFVLVLIYMFVVHQIAHQQILVYVLIGINNSNVVQDPLVDIMDVYLLVKWFVSRIIQIVGDVLVAEAAAEAAEAAAAAALVNKKYFIL
jgi:hypothetical protein